MVEFCDRCGGMMMPSTNMRGKTALTCKCGNIKQIGEKYFEI